MNELDILDQIEAAKGKKKLQILKQHSSHIRLRELLDAALNFKRKFHIKKFDIPTNNSRDGSLTGHDNHSILMSILMELENRAIVGNAAIDKVEKFLAKCSPQQQKWYPKVIRKDLKAGFGISLANKAGFDILEFDVQLAKDGKQCKKLDQILTNGAYASPKFDGYRCIAIVDVDEVFLYSRNGTDYENFPKIKESLLELFKGEQYIFDGEIMSDDFTSMQKSAFASKRGTTVGDMIYHIFDFIPFHEWDPDQKNDKFKTPASTRYRMLDAVFAGSVGRKMLSHGISNLKIVDHTPVKTKKEILDLEKHYISLGFEGVMVNPDIPYYRGKKSNKMLKFKTMKSMDCIIIGFHEGRPGTELEGTLGKLEVAQENNIKCEVGSGFSHEERDWIWANQEKVLGRVIEVKYQELTDKSRMRFPIFLRWRPDKDK